MKTEVLQRILEVFRQSSISETQFAKRIGVNQKTLNQQFKEERSLSLETVLSTLRAFEDISAEWLLRGKGNIYNTENSIPDIKTGDMQSVYETVVRDKDEQIEKMKAEINQLIGENSIMREQLGIASRKISNKSA